MEVDFRNNVWYMRIKWPLSWIMADEVFRNVPESKETKKGREHLMNSTEREADSAGSIDPQVGIWAGERSKSEQSEDLDHLVDFLGLVLDNVYSGIIVCDLHCRIVYMN
jgi:hypothetical protein